MLDTTVFGELADLDRAVRAHRVTGAASRGAVNGAVTRPKRR